MPMPSMPYEPACVVEFCSTHRTQPRRRPPSTPSPAHPAGRLATVGRQRAQASSGELRRAQASSGELSPPLSSWRAWLSSRGREGGRRRPRGRGARLVGVGVGVRSRSKVRVRVRVRVSGQGQEQGWGRGQGQGPRGGFARRRRCRQRACRSGSRPSACTPRTRPARPWRHP